MRPKLQFRAVVVLCFVLLLGGCEASPTPQPAGQLTTTSVPPTTTSVPVPMVDTLPALGLPGTRSAPAGEYGWTGTRGSKSGMHSVIENESSPDGFRQTQLIFAVENDCFPTAPDADPIAVTVAALDGLYLEPYDDPNVLFMSSEGGETTGAYALPIGERTLCAYLTWDADTTPDELNAAREVLESIRGEPYGEDGIRINFTLPAGWDTG